MPYNYGLCPCCYQKGTLFYIHRLFEELGEFIACPCVDEASDVSAILSQIIHNITDLVIYLPLSKNSFNKGYTRWQLHGCVRSWRNACTNIHNQ